MPAKSATPTPSGTPSKAPTPAPPPPAAPQSLKTAEATPKPAAAPEKAVEEPSKPPAGAQPTSISLAMRQLGQEAALKAKEGMKRSTKAIETFSGAGTAEPAKKSPEKAAAVPPPISVETSSENYAIETRTLLQSPTSSAWKNDANEKSSIPQHEFQKVELLQSPTSTSWKPVTEHTGSKEPLATRKEVDQAEEHKAVSKDEDKEDEEDEDDGDEEGEEDEEEEKKKEDEDEDDDEKADGEDEDEEEDSSDDD